MSLSLAKSHSSKCKLVSIFSLVLFNVYPAALVISWDTIPMKINTIFLHILFIAADKLYIYMWNVN